jgi:hypothetical protein
VPREYSQQKTRPHHRFGAAHTASTTPHRLIAAAGPAWPLLGYVRQNPLACQPVCGATHRAKSMDGGNT